MTKKSCSIVIFGGDDFDMGISFQRQDCFRSSPQPPSIGNVTSSRKGDYELGERCTARGDRRKYKGKMSDQSMTPRWSSLMVPMANFFWLNSEKPWQRKIWKKRTLTISVASTRVPTIFSLTRVFLSMI